MISSITEYLEELKESFAPTVARAEDEEEEEGGEQESGEQEGGDGEEEEEEEDEDEDEDEDEEEEEGGDQLDALRAECSDTPEGKELSHHFLECVDRVHKAEQQPGYEDSEWKEDCIEEFFHLSHYVDNCAAPKLFSKLK